jgi:hypothetical protein
MNELKPLERIRIRASAKEINRFFTRLDHEAENLPGFHILFGQHILLLRFPDDETADRYRFFLDLVTIEHEGEPDGIITILKGEIRNYLNISAASEKAACLEYTGENALIRYLKWPERIQAYQIQSNQQYIIMSGSFDEYAPPQASFHWEFHNFSMSHRYAFIHSGAAGLNGEGVLISSMGGSGKSTTVLSCLLDGFDYVSDDYLILDRETAAAYPLYNSGILNADSLHRLPELNPLTAGHVLRRPDRHIIDLSGYRNQFRHGMKIKAVVHPRILHTDEAEREALIRKDPLHVGKTQMLITSVRQNGLDLMNDPSVFHYLSGAVSALPSYELLLSPDRQSNCRALRDLICSLSGTA